MNAVIYCRVSSREQVQGTSLESQQIACQDYARTHAFRVLRTFVEEGESAKFADRTELVSLLEFCRDNKGLVNVLLVWKVDRFARNVADHFSVKATLQKYGVHIVSVTEPIDANPEGKLMETILAGFAQFDNDIRATRTVQGMRRKVQEGIYPWKPPLGYRSQNTGREKKVNPDQPDQPVFGLLQKAWKQYATGAFTIRQVTVLLSEWGVETQRGSPLSDKYLGEMFRNPYYAGVIIDPWSGEEYDGRHPPMVSRQEFALVQQVMRRRRSTGRHYNFREEFPLRGLVRCPECNQYMTASHSRGRSRLYPYYHCAKRQCGRYGKSLTASEIHEEFKAYLLVIAPRPELLGSIQKVAVDVLQEQERTANERRATAKVNLNRLNQELQELIQMRARHLISDDEFTMQRSILLERRQAIEAMPNKVGFGHFELHNLLEEMVSSLRTLLDTWRRLLPHVRYRFQQLIFPVGYIAGKIGTAELGLVFKLFNHFGVRDPVEVAPTSEEWNRIYKELLEFSELLRGEIDNDVGSKRRVPKRRREADPSH